MVHSDKWFLQFTSPTDKCIQFEISKPVAGLYFSVMSQKQNDLIVTVPNLLGGRQFFIVLTVNNCSTSITNQPKKQNDLFKYTVSCWHRRLSNWHLWIPSVRMKPWYRLGIPYGDRFGSTLAQVMPCCLMTPSHYLNQCWLTMRSVFWHSPKSNSTRSVPWI